MLFWIVAALLTLAASLAVLVPLARRPADAAGQANDIEVYKDQLGELDRDLARGVVNPAEADNARAEIGRRILKASSDAGRPPRGGPRIAGTIASVAVLIVPLLSWGLYGAIGSPDLPAQPLEARLSKQPSESSPDELVARAEQALRANPGDGHGWDVLAPVYQRLGRAQESIFAYRNAIRILGDSPERWTGLGVALSDVAGGTVSKDAHDALEKALALDPAFAKARFFLTVALAQEGRYDEAIAAWTKLASELPDSSEWRDASLQAAQLASERKAAAAAARPSGPNAEDLANAEGMTPQDRTTMIEGMVASLDEKLKANPADPQGWARLVRSYLVLKRQDAARDALMRGQKALGAEGAAQLTEFAKGMGLTLTE